MLPQFAPSFQSNTSEDEKKIVVGVILIIISTSLKIPQLAVPTVAY